jgi:amino acid adenylation domain-containing protein
MSPRQSLPRRPDEGSAPLSFAQRAIWRADQLAGGAPLHNEAVAFRLSGPLDVAALRAALHGVVAAHEIFRSAVRWDPAAEPHQVFAGHVDLPLDLIDLTATPAPELDAAVAARLAGLAAVPFALDRAPLARAHLLRLRHDEHVLALVAHHLVIDAGGFAVLLEDLAARYAGGDPAAANDGIGFGDYAAWQRGSAEPGADLGYWARRLAGAPAAAELPADSPQGTDAPADGGAHHFVIPPVTADGLRTLARAERATLASVVLAGFSAVLHRFAGQDELVVGIPVATRGRPGLSRVIGPLLNLIPFRIGVSGAQAFTGLLDEVRRSLKADLAHRDVPLDLLVDELRPVASAGRAPLFQLLYVFHSGPPARLDLPGVTSAALPVHNGTAKYDLSLIVRPRPDGALDVTLEYRASLFTGAVAASLAEAVGALLEAVTDDAGRPVGALPLTSGPSSAAGCPVERDYGGAPDVSEAVRLRAATEPHRPAVRQGRTVLSYADLDERAGLAAGRLAVRPGDRVAVRLDRTVDVIPVVLGIWRAGGVLVPVDGSLPVERARYLIEDSGAKVLVTDLPPDGLSGIAERVLAPGSLFAPGTRPASPRPPAAGEPAYLIYTSGSTGKPKGVLVRHGNLTNLLHTMVETPGIGPDDLLLAITSLSFDISVLELFGPLMAGAQVWIAPSGVAGDGEALAGVVGRSAATILQATPSVWRGLVAAGWRGRPGLRAWTGGEALPWDLAEDLGGRATEVWNLYGPTETTIWSTAGRVVAGEPVTVGRPVAGTTCTVVDRYGRPVPRGWTGELVIGGAGVSAGYWDRPGLTARAFAADPADPDGGQTRYHTGDRARVQPDGRIRVLGRIDSQVKINGHRVELGEIEHVLSGLPGIRQAAVVLDAARPAAPRLVAFVVAEPSPTAEPLPAAEPDEAGLRGELGRVLPAAVVPSVILALPALPLNTSGKVDRPRLTAQAAGIAAGVRRRPPAGATEQLLARIWAEVTGLDPDGIGTDDDFLAAGGNSLAATRLLGRVRGEFGSAPTLAGFYARPTIAALAAALPEPAARPSPGPRAAKPARVPLTDQQRQLWLADQLAPGSARYNLAAAIRLSGRLDVPALAAAFDDLVARHDLLAARCATAGGEPVLVHDDSVAARLRVVDLAPGLDGRTAGELARAEATRPFALAEGPFLRATLLRLGPDEAELVVTAHHLALDGWSIGVASHDLAALYAARVAGTVPPAPLEWNFFDHAAEQAARAVDEEPLEYWTRRLSGHSGVLRLPADLTCPAGAAGQGAQRPAEVPADLVPLVRATAVRLRTTPFAVVLSVFATVLGRYGGTDDVVVGVPVANRADPRSAGLLGCFAGTLPLRVDLSGTPAFGELVTRVARTVVTDLDRPGVPFDRLVERLGLPRDPARPPIVQAMLVFQNLPAAGLELPGLTTRTRPLATGAAKYDLTLSLTDRPGSDSGSISGELEYAADRFSPELVDRFFAHVVTVLRAGLAAPGRPVDEIDLAPPAESTGGGGIPALPVHEVFREHARRTPGAVAVRHSGGTLDYAGLDRWSDAVAGELLRRGAGPGEFVAVLLPAGPAQIAAVLGVAKSGAAFVVLEPGDPGPRTKEILADAGAALLLSTPEMLTAQGNLLSEDGLFDGVPVAVLPAAAEAGETVPAESVVPRGTVLPEFPLCLVYTSGSTGRPKGIVLPHRAFTQFAAWQRDRFGIGPDSRIAQWASFSYDAAYTEVFAALGAGASLCLPEADARRDPVAMVRWLRAEGVTQLQTVPAFFRLVLDVLDGAGLPALAHVLLAGEVLPPGLVADWGERAVRTRLHNLYGPTECILATHRELRPGEAFEPDVPLGTAIPAREVLVLDHRRRPCPIGVPGEVYLRSPLLAGRYHRRPAETAAAYGPDPWRPGGFLYRTGDLACRRAGGELAFVGRLGRQVKLRGNRVELEGVEAVLAAHPRVREAAAIVHEGALLAYAVSTGATSGELRAHLADRLPAAARPDEVVLLADLPRTRTGKRDLSRLPLPVPGARTAPAVTPLRGAERTVAAAWCTVLGLTEIDRHTSFFEAGGQSLLAAKLQLELGARLGVEIRLVDVFAHPTVAGFAEWLTRGGPAGHRPPEPAARGDRRRQALLSRARARQNARANPRTTQKGPL